MLWEASKALGFQTLIPVVYKPSQGLSSFNFLKFVTDTRGPEARFIFQNGLLSLRVGFLVVSELTLEPEFVMIQIIPLLWV